MVHSGDISYRIPAGLAYIWGPNGSVDKQQLETACPQDHATVLGPGLIAYLPRASHPEVIEGVISLVRALFIEPFDETNHDGPSTPLNQLRAIIFPASIEHRLKKTRLVSDGLIDDLRRAPPRLAAGRVYLTGHAIRELETPWDLSKAPIYTGSSGRSRTLWIANKPNHGTQHFRNPKVLRLNSPWIPRQDLEEARDALVTQSVLRVLGPVGVGKSRMVHELLSGCTQLWAHTWHEDRPGPSLTQQIAFQLHESRAWPTPQLPDNLNPKQLMDQQDSPFESSSGLRGAITEALHSDESSSSRYLVLDDLHRAGPEDIATIKDLLSVAAVGRLQILLLGRPASWLDRLAQFAVTVQPLSETSEKALVELLTEGLSIPEGVLERFSEACKGNPFTFEEGLHNLVRRRLLREHYGNFFFSGPRDTQYLPTTRLDRHLLSEALRVDGLEACFRLASAVDRAPKDLLALSSNSDFEALDQLCKIGLFEETEVGGRSFLDFARPAFREAFRQCLEEHVIQRLRGDLLGPMIGDGGAQQAWNTYRSLAGTPKGTEALLEVLALPRKDRPREGLFEALQRELSAHRQREGDDSTEFELLWEYLPLARTHADPTTLIPQIERALELCKPSEPRRMALLALHSEEALVQGELDSAERRAVEGLDLAREQDPLKQSILVLQLGKVLQRQDRHPEAKKLLQDLLKTLDPDVTPSQTAACHYHLGNIYLREQDFELALEHHQIALKHRREQGTSTSIGHSLTSLATLNSAVGNYSRSLALYREALETLNNVPDPSERAFPLAGIGLTLSRLGNFSGATGPLRQALELRTRRADKLGVEISKLSLARNDLDLGHNDRALQESRLALFRLTMIGSLRYRAEAESLIGQLLLRRGKAEEALVRFEDAVRLHRQVGADVDSLFDEAHMIEACIQLGRKAGIERGGQILAERLATAPYPDLGERLDLSLYQAWATLDEMGARGGEANVPLERAYRELCRKTTMLEPELRNQYLQQVPSNRNIMRLAQKEGLASPEKLQELLLEKPSLP